MEKGNPSKRVTPQYTCVQKGLSNSCLSFLIIGKLYLGMFHLLSKCFTKKVDAGTLFQFYFKYEVEDNKNYSIFIKFIVCY